MMIGKLHTQKLDRPEGAQIAASIVALGLHYLDGAMLGPEMLAAAWTALALPLVMIGIRMIGGLTSDEGEAGPPSAGGSCWGSC